MTDPLIFVGTYSVRGSEGIYVYRLTSPDGRLELVSTTPSHNPSFLALSPDRRWLYAANEIGPDGAATAFEIDYDAGCLIDLGTQPTGGHGPCHVAVDPSGRWLLVAHYGDGTHSTLPIQNDGALGPVACIVKNAGTPGPGQQGPHAHSTTPDPKGGVVYACDLGLDRMIVYGLDLRTGQLAETGGVDLQPGSGPRHLALHPSLPLAYVICELDSSVAVVDRHGLSVRQIVSTLRDHFHEPNSCADIHLSANGRFLYGSNRGANTLARYEVAEDGFLGRLGLIPTEGKVPRNFALLPNDLILVANQESDTIVAFRSADGRPNPTGLQTSIPAPVCIVYSFDRPNA